MHAPGVRILAGEAEGVVREVGGGPRVDTSEPVPVALLVPSGSSQPGDEVLARSERAMEARAALRRFIVLAAPDDPRLAEIEARLDGS